MEHLREIGKVHVAEQLAAALEPRVTRAARAAQGGQVTPTLPLSASNTATPTATLTPTQPPSPTPLPTITRPRPTAAVTPTPAATLSATVETPASTPTATASPIPTPTPTSTPQEKPPGGTIVEIEYLWRSRPNGNYPVDMYRLRFQTLDENDQIAETQADLFIPYVETETTFPILVHAPGTTGIGDGCAPLNEQILERNWGSYRVHSLAYAAQGYVVIFPNGLGFDDPDRTHPYFIAELQAHVLLDAARAVYNLADDLSVGDTRARPAKAVFFMGYSSGGHAAFAAKDWVGTYAPELSVKGIIGHGPTTNVETLLREDPVFSPYIIYAYRDFYGDEVIDVADVLDSQWVPAFDTDVTRKCVDDIFVHYSRSARAMYTPEFREILYGGKLDTAFPLFAEKLSANDTGVLNGRKTSVLILQGTGDTVVTPDSQRAFRDRLCEQGNLVTYLEYSAVPHAEIRRTSFGDTLWWMQRIAQGEILKGDCEAINLPR
jgi:dienelactone hydrolase